MRPRHKLKGSIVQKWEREAISTLFPNFGDLSAPISDLEPDGKEQADRFFAHHLRPNFDRAA